MKQEDEEKLQYLRDIAKAVSVAGKTETSPFSPKVISVICEMEVCSEEWLKILEEEMRRI